MIPFWQKATRKCKMATLDDSPSLFAGQQWSDWIANLPLTPENDPGVEVKNEVKKEENDSMKLSKDDKYLFGTCPSQDEFYLVVCEKCNRVVKPQAFRKHLEIRHGIHEVQANSSSRSRSFSSSSTSSKLSLSSPTKSRSATYKLGHSVPTKASVKEVPPSVSNAQKMGAALNAKLGGAEKSKKNHSVPFVKVERMDESVMKKAFTHHNNDNNVIGKTSPIGKLSPVNKTSSPHKMSPSGKMSPLNKTSPVSKMSPVGKTSPLTNGSHSFVNSSSRPSTPTTPVSQSMPALSVALSTFAMATTAVTTATTSLCSRPTMTTTVSSMSTISPVVTPSHSNNSVVSNSSSAGSISSSGSRKKSLEKFLFPTKGEYHIPCKDREFDANKHCGVICEDTGKNCTRSLTCKTHALSLRRKVPGRRKPFDDLLKEHRAAKEEMLKQKAEMKAAQQAAAGQSKSASSHGASTTVPAKNNNQSIKREPHSQQSHTIHHPTSPQKLSRPFHKPNHVNPHRPSFPGLHSPSFSVKEESSRHFSDLCERLSDDDEDADGSDRTDSSYLPFHPRPAAVCSFGARYHQGLNGKGCYTFGRRADFFRAAFLNVLEKHLNPPPPKKLCVESNLPKDTQSLSNSKDPYEFNLIDTSHAAHNANAVLNNSSANRNINIKQKPKSASISNRSKSKEAYTASVGSRSPGHSNSATLNSSGALKRKRSGSATSSPSSHSTTTTQIPTSLISSISINSHTSTPLTAIAIPNVNLSGTTLSHFNANLSTGKYPKNNILKDVGFVVTGIDPSIVNGQYVNIGGTTAQLTAVDEKTLQQTHVISNKNSNPTKLVNNLEALQAIQKNNFIATVPQNAILMDGGTVQPGTTVLAPVTLAAGPSGNSVVSLATTISPPQSSPSAASPSPLFRSGSVSPQVSSPLPNGIVPSPSDKTASTQRHALIHHRAKTVQSQASHGLLPNTVIPSSSNPQICPSQILTTPFAQLVRPANLMTKASASANKVMAFPLTNISVAGQQHQTHTLYIASSDNSQCQQQTQQMSNSPSHLLS